MKKPIWFYLCLLTLITITSCASRPVAPPHIVIIETEEETKPEPSVITLLPIEVAIQRVKQNGQDIARYFILDENRQIIVRAALREGTSEFEVIYNMETAKTLGNSVYEVSFTIQEKGTEKILEDTLIWRPGPGNAGLLLSFDDDYMETWEKYLDLFDNYGARVTFFLQGEFHPFSVIALNRGHDVGYHSLSHLDLRKVSRTEFFNETILAADSFRRAGIPVSSFAYPYGFSEPWMHEALFPSFSVFRGYGVTFRLFKRDEIWSTHISSRAIDNTVLRGEENFDRIMLSMLRTVKFLDGDWILPLTSHDISDTADWGITPRRLEFLLKTAAELNLKFYRFSDF